MMSLSTTVEQITSDADLTEFAECYARELGMNIIDVSFLRGCQVMLFRDEQGNPVGGYSINVDQEFRALLRLPEDIAADIRRQAQAYVPYEIGTLWIAHEHRHGRVRSEIWLHVLDTIIERTDQLLACATISDELYEMYSRIGLDTIYEGPVTDGASHRIKRVMYSENIQSTNIMAVRDLLRKRLGMRD